MPVETKLCGKCGAYHPATSAYFPLQGGKMWSPCKGCRNAARRERQASRPNIQAERKQRFVQSRYGLSWDEYQAMVEASNGCCTICQQAFEEKRKEPFIDHCHSSGKVRGLLCLGCNSALGHFKDSESSLERAILYLQESRRCKLQGPIDYSRYLD